MNIFESLCVIIIVNVGYALYWIAPWDSPFKWLGYVLGPILLGIIVGRLTK
jgi:hypothetical protein